MDDSTGAGEAGRGEVEKDDSASFGRTASQSVLCPLLRFNFWRQLKSDADRGKSGINEAGPGAATPGVSPTPVPHSRGESSLIGCH